MSNSYEVLCVAAPRPIERIEADTSWQARKAYADKHGCELLDTLARRLDLIDAQWRRRFERSKAHADQT